MGEQGRGGSEVGVSGGRAGERRIRGGCVGWASREEADQRRVCRVGEQGGGGSEVGV